MAAACVRVMDLDKAAYAQYVQPMSNHMNVGSGSDITICELAEAVSRSIGYEGQIVFDSTMPDGTPKAAGQLAIDTGWEAKVGLEEGLALAYKDFTEHISLRISG